MALGYQAGQTRQGINAIAIGYQAGQTGQGSNAIAIGYQAGQTGQGINAIAIGYQAGQTGQGINAIAIGYQAGQTGQGINAIAIGASAGQTGQGSNAIAIGASAGQTGQGINAMALGYQAGQTRQGSNSIAIGYQAGQTGQGINAIAIGYQAGQTGQGSNAIAIGYQAGQTGQGSNAMALGYQAGQTGQGSFAMALGYQAGQTGQGSFAMALGYQAGQSGQNQFTVAVGYQAGVKSQGHNSVAIGTVAGFSNQGSNAIAIGQAAGQTIQGSYAVAFGKAAGQTSQGSSAVAVGAAAGFTCQGSYAIALGSLAGSTNQASFSVAVGANSGYFSQGSNAVALGYQAGQTGQGANAVAIGASAGQTGQGSNAIAIGYKAGQTGQSANSIIINASGAALASNNGSNTLTVNPIRFQTTNTASLASLFYNSNSSEVVYGLQTTPVASGGGGGPTGSIQYRDGSGATGSSNLLYDLSTNRLTLKGSIFFDTGAIVLGSTGLAGNTIAIGYQAGQSNQGSNAMALGYQAGKTGQGSNAVAVGSSAGNSNQGSNAVAVGSSAGNLRQGSSAIAIGENAGQTSQGNGGVAVGISAGYTSQGNSSIAIGTIAGQTSQGTQAVAIGVAAGSNSQTSSAVAIGEFAGNDRQSFRGVAIGSYAAQILQGPYAVAVGSLAGITSQGQSATALGYQAGYCNQGASAIAIGENAGYTSQSGSAIAIGSLAGQTSQNTSAIAIGSTAGRTRQSTLAVAIGADAGNLFQGPSSIAIGVSSGLTSQGGSALAVGNNAGYNYQGVGAVAVGFYSGYNYQGTRSVAIGSNAGNNSQSRNAVAIGPNSGFSSQRSNAIAVGENSGLFNQGSYSIALGYKAGESNQAANSIVLNATSVALNNVNSNTLVVKPIRSESGSLSSYKPMYYNTDTGEVISTTTTSALTENFTVAGGSASASTLGYSYDGVIWQTNATSSKVLTFADGSCNAVGWNGTTWVAGGVGETALIYSNDGINWQRNDGSQPGVASTVRTVLDSGNWRYAVDISYGVPPSATQKQNFGTSLAFNNSGNRLAVGSPYSNPTDISYGFVSIYDFSLNSDTWQKTADLSGGAVGSNNQTFGKTMAMNAAGTRIVIGAPNNNNGLGCVYSFDCSLNSTSWVNRTLLASGNANTERFGSALALSSDGNRLLVGAPDFPFPFYGAVYDYTFNNNTWVKNVIAIAYATTAGSKFGTSIAMNGAGNRCLISAPNFNTNTGLVYTYDFSYNRGCWGLTPPVSSFSTYDASFAMNTPRELFGYSLAMDISGVRCAIGAPGDGTGTGADRGHVYIYDYTASQGWGLLADISGNVAGERFGYSVSLNSAGTRLIVGAPNNPSPPVRAGKSYVYNYQNLIWTRETTDVSLNRVIDCSMGWAVAQNGAGDRFASGAPTGDGRAFIFDRQMLANAVTWNGANWVAGGNSVSTGDSATSSALATSKDGINWQAVSPYTVNTTPPLTKQYFGEFPSQMLGTAMAFNAAGTRLAIGGGRNQYATIGQLVDLSLNGVYIYDYDISLNRWSDTYTAKFTMPSVDVYAVAGYYQPSFGSSISLNAAGDRLAIGAFNATPNGMVSARYSGAVYIYHYNYTTKQWPTTPTWKYYRSASASPGDGGNFQFGSFVIFNAKGDRLAVSARNNAITGYVYVFHYNYLTNSWPGVASGYAGHTYAAVCYQGDSPGWNIGACYQFGFNAAGDRLALVTSQTATPGALWLIHYDYKNNKWPFALPGGGGTNVQSSGAASVTYNDLAVNAFGYAAALNAAGDKVAVVATMTSSCSFVYIIEYNYKTQAWPPSVDKISTSAIPPYSAYYSGPYRSFFGTSLQFSASGNRLLAGSVVQNANSPFETIAIFDRNPVTGWPASDKTWTPAYSASQGLNAISPSLAIQATYLIQGSDTTPLGLFAGAMNADGTRIAGSTSNSDLFGTDRGYVNIYDLSTKLQLQQCTALTTTSNNTLAAGQGVSTVFAASDWNGLTWQNITDDRNILYSGGDGRTMVRTQALQDTVGIASTFYQNYGFSVATNQAGTLLAVGCPDGPTGGSVNPNSIGQVFIYNYNNGWQQTQLMPAPTFTNKFKYYFGKNLCMNASGSKLLISMNLNGNNVDGTLTNFSNSGDVYSYNYVNGQYLPDISPLVPHTYIAGDAFGGGSALAMNAAGTRLVVGAHFFYTGVGKVYCYNYDAQNGWVADAMTPVLVPITSQFSGFGKALAMNAAGTQLTVGEPNYTFSATDISGGKVSSYTYSTLTGWQNVQELFGVNGSSLGSALALNSVGSRLVVGAPKLNVAASIGVSSNPKGISSDGTNVWVANSASNTISKINIGSGTVNSYGYPANPLSNPTNISSDGTNVWVANFDGSKVSKFDINLGSFVNTYTVGTNPNGISSDGTNVWVANSGSNTISKINIGFGTVNSYGYPANPLSLPFGISSDGTNVWVANFSGSKVSKFDINLGSFVNTYTVGTTPYGISSDGTNVWVTNSGGNNVSKINIGSGVTTVNYATVGSAPYGISSDGTNVWVANSGGGASKINILTGAVSSYTVGSAPFGISSVGTNVWVANTGSNTVSKISTSGIARTYNYGSNGQWALDSTLNGLKIDQQFGAAVALNAAGDRLSVGAPFTPQSQNPLGGQVYNYVYQNSWQRAFDLSGSVGGGLQSGSATAGAGFGWALALNGLGNRLVISHVGYLASGSYNLNTVGTGIVYSYDEPFALRQANSIAANTSLVVAGGKSIRNPLAYSLDNGQTWTESVSGGPNLFVGPDRQANIWGLAQDVSYNQCNAVTWNGSKWVAGGLGGMAYSYDGMNWLPNSFAGFRTCNAIAWNGTSWLASGILTGGQQGQATSTDGITWAVNNNGVALGNALAVRRTNISNNTNISNFLANSVNGANDPKLFLTLPEFIPSTNGIVMVWGSLVSNTTVGGTLTLRQAGVLIADTFQYVASSQSYAITGRVFSGLPVAVKLTYSTILNGVGYSLSYLFIPTG